MDPTDTLEGLVVSQLTGQEGREAVERLVYAVGQQAGIAAHVVDAVIAKIVRERFPSRGSSQPVRLLVDWGELPRVGHQARPELLLICPGYRGHPEIRVRVDRDLDHDPDDPLRKPQREDDGLWSFCIPFRTTTGGVDCRPGQYVIDVRVLLRQVGDGHPRFFRCRIRLKVPSGAAGGERVLEIDSDGQSIVNLHGHDLKAFSHVVLKAGAEGIVNIENLIGPARSSEHPSPPPTPITFEYVLKVDQEREQMLPCLSTVHAERVLLETAGLYLESGRRILLLAKRQVRLGRHRDNDIVLRFLPRSEANDALSRTISRNHAVLEMTGEGLVLRDASSTGIELDYCVVKGQTRISSALVREATRISLGCTGSVSKPFSLDMHMLARPGDVPLAEVEEWDEVYCRLPGEGLSRTWRLALESGFDAVRLRRVDSLADAEEYVLVYREARIGGSPDSCAVVLGRPVGPPTARLLHIGSTFCLERVREDAAVLINGGELPVRCLAPLVPGMELQLDGVRVKFDRFAQAEIG